MTSLPSDDDELTLPSDTLVILNQFLLEKAEREKKEEDDILAKSGSDSMFEEDWQLSQFWYNDKTKADIGNVVQKLIEPGQWVALLSCPSLYKTIKTIHDDVRIFEYDKRFSVFGDDFIFYDLNEAFQKPTFFDEHVGVYDIIIADPPFLSEECILKTAHIVKKLMKASGKLILCSGEVVEPWVTKYLDLKRCKFCPEHERNLGNQFVSYSNFNLDELL